MNDRKETRELREVILHRADLLKPSEQVLCQCILDRGCKFSEIAALTDRSTRSVQRQLAAIMKRLTSNTTELILSLQHSWTDEMKTVAVMYFITGLTLREIADVMDTSLHYIRLKTRLIDGLLKEATAKTN